MAQSLYQRLGEIDGIRKLVDDVVEAHMHNPVIQARFLPYRDRPEDLANAKKHLTDFFAAGAGGPIDYTGRSLLDAHRGMNISAGEYMAATDDIMDQLERHGIDEETRKDVLAIAFALKDEIIAV